VSWPRRTAWQLLYSWPDGGWQRGTVARLRPRTALSHAARGRSRRCAARRHGGVRADSARFDSASYVPGRPDGCCCPPPPPPRPFPPMTSGLGFGCVSSLCLVTVSRHCVSSRLGPSRTV
jgi:hypothetical protein